MVFVTILISMVMFILVWKVILMRVILVGLMLGVGDYDDDDNADVDGGGCGDGVDHDAFDDHAHSSMAPRVRRKMRHESYTSTVPAQRRVILDQLKS